MVSPEPIPRRRLYEDVLERLSERIRSGEIAPGEQLPAERDLMEHYGVGRPAIREALQSLERAGIIEIVHGERARVVVPTADHLMRQIGAGAQHLLRSNPHSLEHLKGARLFLETGMARLAALNATDGDIELLRKRLEEQRAAKQNPEEFLVRDMAFHRELARTTGNPIFPAIVEAVFQWAREYYRGIVRAPGAEELTLEEHQKVVEAVARRDADAAAKAMEDHLTRANALYKTIRGESVTLS
ncbi:transcriptional regulator NanR (plasmid) [Cupriavidus pinatubonensis]|uniref:transcriptional regulator NanR n=1 Tax=Cupriavidus pinatubonensis TaxID=248026 RepID=UPI001C7350C2|nr:transcriptional regulator NanR [Cupriavidus pinatubonensis]QYY33852.1 transcriptional regulator NanR [Cupriavidus pinatubonensis]